MAGICPFPLDQIAAMMGGSSGGSAPTAVPRKTGDVTLSADGVSYHFAFPHTLGVMPSYANAAPKNALAASPSAVTWDANNIMIDFLLAPDAGNIMFTWIALG